MKCSYDFDGTLAVVTGGSGVIGGGIAAEFGRAGADLALVYGTNRSAAEENETVVRGYGVRSALFGADLEHEEDVRRLFEEIKERLGQPGVLINCAGIYPVSSLAETGGEAWRHIVDSNLTAAFYCTREFVRHAAGAAEGGAGPSVVNIASIDASRPFAGHAHYAAAKAGMLGLTRGAAVDYAPEVRVNAVSPGLIARPGIEESWPEGVSSYRSAAPLERIGTPEDVARGCLFLSSEAAAWITGQELTVDGGLSVTSGW
jgi:NAD(P)-dependent dehydrogenase (short-subunit alcohol dehydrogenase family)